MGAASGDARFTSQNPPNKSLLVNEFPMLGEPFKVSWPHYAPALPISAGACEIRIDIQSPVSIGNPLSGLDVANRDFQITWCSHAGWHEWLTNRA